MVAIVHALPAVACCLWALLAARPTTPSAPGAASSPRFTNPTGTPNAIQWLVVSPRPAHPVRGALRLPHGLPALPRRRPHLAQLARRRPDLC